MADEHAGQEAVAVTQRIALSGATIRLEYSHQRALIFPYRKRGPNASSEDNQINSLRYCIGYEADTVLSRLTLTEENKGLRLESAITRAWQS